MYCKGIILLFLKVHFILDKNIIKKHFKAYLLTESATVSDIEKAIAEKRILRFYYEGDGVNAQGYRIAEIYAYGLTKAGNPVIRAFQLSGDTKTKRPAWKMFLLSKMNRVTFQGNFNKPREGFNPDGDKTMRTVYSIAQFGKGKGLISRIKSIFGK